MTTQEAAARYHQLASQRKFIEIRDILYFPRKDGKIVKGQYDKLHLVCRRCRANFFHKKSSV
jgi:hypothetical protein